MTKKFVTIGTGCTIIDAITGSCTRLCQED
jgi:hypothetical protein